MSETVEERTKIAIRQKPRSEKRLVGDHGGHLLEFEYVPSANKAREMYVVFDGRRDQLIN
jgi:hypothetical protein